MNISCAPRGSVAIKHPKQGISDIAGAGFSYIMLDISLACSTEKLEKSGESYQEKAGGEKSADCQGKIYEDVKPLLEQCRVQHLKCNTARSPYLKRGSKRENPGDLIRQLAMESISICGDAKCAYLIVQPLLAGEAERDVWESNREYYLSMANQAKRENVQILLVNQCRDIHGHLVRGLCSDGNQAAEWIDGLNALAGEERFGFCMDVGACNLSGQNMYEFATTLGSRIKAVILSDCYGGCDGALLPFTSVSDGQFQTDWLNLIRGLREIEFDGEMILDFRDTAAAFSPILRPGLLKMAKSVAEYFEWQIGIEKQLKKYSSRVLFGAGNMCRNYMKCYGEKYPPMFTCDNNRKIWETTFCGLTVRPPEALKELSEDCVVIICNIYYREIEEQLRQIGIRNPIEYFNDEYMPAYHFDRLEVEN